MRLAKRSAVLSMVRSVVRSAAVVISALSSVAWPGARAFAAETPVAPPPLYVAALPATVSLVAWLPVDKAADQVDLDLRVEVVLPLGCNEKVVGLLRPDPPGHAGAKSGAAVEEADRYEVVLTRPATGECKKDATRVGARTAIRMQLAEGKTRELRIGEHVMQVSRQGKQLTLDGNAPTGDVPGAPATARPSAFAVGEVSAAQVAAVRAVAGDRYAADVAVKLTARFPTCAEPPVGLLALGDAGTRFALTHLQPLARTPQDVACKGKGARTVTLSSVVRPARQRGVAVDDVQISVGDKPLSFKLPAPVAAATPAAATPTAATPAAAAH